MPLERRLPGDPREWLNRARSNLVQAQATLPGVYLEDLCFNAHQAAEKAIKAVLIARGVDYPFVHDLARLLTLLCQDVPPEIAAAARLTRFAAVTRYPGAAEPVTPEEHQRAVATAEAVVRWAEEQIAETRY